MRLFKTRYSILFSFIVFFLVISFLTRVIFMSLCWQKANITFLALMRVMGKGLIFDTVVTLFLILIRVMNIKKQLSIADLVMR